MTTTTKPAARVTAIDAETGKRYVKTQTVEGATVTVTHYTGQMTGDKWSWASATYDVTSPAGQLFAGAITWNGKSFSVGGKAAASLTKAVRAVLGTGQLAAPKAKAAPKASDGQAARPSTRKRRGAEKTGHPRADQIAADSGESVIEADPETGLPRIRPEVAAKADAIVAAQLARTAEAGK